MNDTAPMAASETCEQLATDFERNMLKYKDLMKVKDTMDSTLTTYTKSILLAARALYLGDRSPKDTDDGEWHMVKDPLEWSEEELYALKETRAWEEWSDGTRNLVKSALKSYYKMHRRTDLSEDPVFFAARRRMNGVEYRDLKAKSLPDAEYMTVLDECRRVILDPDAKDMDVYRHFCCYIQAALGLRAIAVANMSVGDVRIDLNYVHIAKDKREQVHDVPLDVPMREEYERFMSAREGIIADLLSKQGGDVHAVAKLHDLSRAGAPLFFSTDQTGRTYLARREPRHIGSMNGRVAKSILGRHVNPHMFRHSKIFHLLEVEKWDIHQVAKYVGHSSIEMTYSYVDADLADLQANIARRNGDVEQEPAPVEAPAPAPSGDDPVLAKLKADYLAGLISPEQFVATVAALK